MTVRFKRKIKVLIDAPGKDIGRDFSNMHVDCSIDRTTGQGPDTCHLRIHGASKATSIRLDQEGSQLFIHAGYGESPPVVFTGNIKSFDFVKRNPGTILKIEADDGGDAYRDSFIAEALQGQVKAEHAIRAAAKAMSMNVDFSFVSVLVRERLDNVQYDGIILDGNASDIMTGLCKSLGLEWSIVNNSVEVRSADFDPSTVTVPLLTPYSGLIGSVEKTEKGVKFKALHGNNPLEIGKFVKIQDAVNAGIYRIVKLSMSLSNHSEDFYVSCEANSL